MDDLKGQTDADKRQAKPVISPEEMQRRLEHVESASSNGRIAGFPISDASQEICEAYIRGEIEAGDLVEEYVKRQQPTKPLVPNKETIEAMEAARRGELTKVGHPRNLLKSLNTDENDPILANPEAVAEIAIRAFARAKDQALAENERLGVPSYGTDGEPLMHEIRREGYDV